jgi:Zn-dependent peptidase ImmA (M78 family)
MAAREKLSLGLTGRLAISLEWLLEKRVRPVYGVEIDVVDDESAELSDAFAAYLPAERVLRVRESVMRKAELEDHEATFTIFHEIGHICLHSDAVFHRNDPSRRPPRNNDPEWQADRFAVEFSIDRQELIKKYQDDAVSASNYFKLPHEKVRQYMIELRNENVIVPSDDELAAVLREQARFDFD